MTTPLSPKGPVERRWRETLATTADCVPIERLGDELTTTEQAHVAGCARCQAELALFASLDAGEPRPDEGAAVAWVAAETRRRLGAEGIVPAPAAVTAPRRTSWLPSWALVAASAVAVIGGAVLLRTPAVTVEMPGGAVYRSAGLEVVAPSGDVEAVPESFSWTPVAGAVRYEVRVREVDGTEVWRGTSADPRLALPAAVRSQVLPAKTLEWQVTASDAAGRPLTDSGVARFRLRAAR